MLSVNRNQRSRQRTQQKLIDAAYRVMSRSGVESATINEITEEADVGFGSFYNYFTSKDEIARVAFRDQAKKLSDQFDEINAGIEDPSVRLSRNFRRILFKTKQDPVWGWFIVHAEFALQDLRTAFWKGHLRNLHEGLESGRYHFRAAPETVTDAVFGAVLSTMRTILEGRANSRVETELVQLIMTLLGVPSERAAALAREALPEEGRKMIATPSNSLTIRRRKNEKVD